MGSFVQLDGASLRLMHVLPPDEEFREIGRGRRRGVARFSPPAGSADSLTQLQLTFADATARPTIGRRDAARPKRSGRP
jgi:hypothetical protein